LTSTAGNPEILEFLRLKFEGEADYARRRGKPGKECFERLKATVAQVPDELLSAYVEMFDGLADSERESELVLRIHIGLWKPESATEYLQQFVALASGTADGWSTGKRSQGPMVG
jgi:hypothetical protein